MLDTQQPADRHHLRQHFVIVVAHLESWEAARYVPAPEWLRFRVLPSEATPIGLPTNGASPVLHVVAVVDDHVVEALEVVSLVHRQRVGKKIVVLVQGALDVCSKVSETAKVVILVYILK